MVWFVDVSPALFVFLGLSVFGTVFVLLSAGAVGVWFGLECNFFGFVPLLNGKTIEESETAMKYFIIQGMGSGFIFLGVCLMMVEGLKSGLWDIMSFGGVMFVLGLMVKVGLFPFHFWFPSVMGGSSWFNCFMLSTWQKLGVFYVIGGCSMGILLLGFVVWSATLTSVVGGLGGVGQVYFRPIMAYSSLVHSGWMVAVCLVSELSFFLYYVIYMFIVGYLFRMLSFFQVSNLSLLFSSGFSGSKDAWSLVLVSLLSLGGLPPLLGSSVKLLGILMIFPLMKGTLIFLVMSSVIGLFYYLSILFSSSLSFGLVSGFFNTDVGSGPSLVKSVLSSFTVNVVFGFVVFVLMGSGMM